MARPIALAVRGAMGMVAILPPLRTMVSVRWPRVLGGGAESGGHQQGADLVGVQADGVRLVVEVGSTNMDHREWARVRSVAIAALRPPGPRAVHAQITPRAGGATEGCKVGQAGQVCWTGEMEVGERGGLLAVVL